MSLRCRVRCVRLSLAGPGLDAVNGSLTASGTANFTWHDAIVEDSERATAPRHPPKPKPDVEDLLARFVLASNSGLPWNQTASVYVPAIRTDPINATAKNGIGIALEEGD